MCEHCGCRGVEPIAELMDEHFSMLETAARVRERLVRTDLRGAAAELDRLRSELAPHVWVEEHGLFAAMRESGDFVDRVDELERDHLGIDSALAHLEPTDPGWTEQVVLLLDLLEEHIAKENLGLFPVAVVSLGLSGWETVTAAAEARPSVRVS